MVHFVGAGSGATDLITVRGARLLGEAGVIIYAGSLVNKELLAYAREEAVLYDSAYMTLPQVLEVIDNNREKEIVRLHTGDPSIYGAIREQMDALESMNIAYDICPGVSSLFGAAAALKTEYTLPGVTQTVIITRMAGRTPVPERESIKALAAHKATMVIFLSVSYTKELSEELIAGGYLEDTPCAIVYKASWADEKIARGTIKELSALAEDNGIKKTALIVVGDSLGNDYELSKLYDKSFTTEYRKGQE
ncbi:precorrin-4 C(11)-methyltransferase [Anaerocolumna sp. AGMB13020]|uniref:precorrin-4 C(11)-methyltransferase n=1 Tax=Anaerocolumna sp. AGMB13020 TaxID=3081750 RepID=UPI002954DC4B|nr:precorrin-4 C(11)-methyltransferase [Anaerocolumna sp. AGMB13020]WOO38624.1 precorrin-4 C(11)-methyltransferase [Anaerocolumna sp. AGMB13020]